MAAYSDINGFPEAGFPVLSDVSDRVCLNTLYWNPLKEAGFILDVVGNNRLAGNLSLAGMLSGVTSITMNGALSGVSTISASGTATLTSSNPLSLTNNDANIRMPGLNSSIGSILERVNKGYFKNLDVANALTVNGNDVALIGDINRYVSGTFNTLPKYNTTGITDSKFTDDGTTPKYNTNTIWHSGNDGAGSLLDSDLLDGIQGVNYMRNYDLITNGDYNKTVVGLVRLDNTNPLLYSQAATTQALVPAVILALGITPENTGSVYIIIASFAAVSALFVLPTYPTLLGAVQMDDTGSTRIGHLVFNHPFLVPGVSAIALSVLFGFLMAGAVL